MKETSPNLFQKFEIGIYSYLQQLSKRVDQLEVKQPWWKDKSFLFSIASFIISGLIGISIWNNEQNDKREEARNTLLTGIVRQVDDLKDFEREYYDRISDVNLDNNTRYILSSIYFSKVNQLTENISKKIEPELAKDLEPTLLNDFSRYLQMVGNVPEAIRINNLALDNCRGKFSKVVIMRTMGALFSLPGDSQNITKSRDFRLSALKATRTSTGDFFTFNTIQSFLLWANDEYFNFKDRDYANALLDSAVLYSDRLPDNPQKFEIIRNIKSAYNLYNDLSSFNFNYGYWTVWDDNREIGTAVITSGTNKSTITIELKNKREILSKLIVASGDFISDRKMEFVGAASYLEKHPQQFGQPVHVFSQQLIITMELELKNAKLLHIRYFELEKPIKHWSLRFVKENDR